MPPNGRTTKAAATMTPIEEPQVPVPEQEVVADEAASAPAVVAAQDAPVVSASAPNHGAPVVTSADLQDPSGSRRSELPAQMREEEDEDDGYLMRALLVYPRKTLLVSEDALSALTCQELLPAWLSWVRYSRLQVTFASLVDAKVVRCHLVDHVGANGKTRYSFGWQHPINSSFLKAKADMPEGVEVLLNGVPAEITPMIVYESLAVHKLQKCGRSAFLQGAGFHRVIDPVSRLGTDKIRGVVVPHPGDTYR
ncbi:unnamed protein product [Closterium sp. NIES-65]|nr:unnamed protein product [Closterium sp. NIES-65]